MIVKMTNAEMVAAVNRITSMQEREEKDGKKLFGNKVKIVYAIKKNKETLLRLLKPYEEARVELLKEHGTNAALTDGVLEIRKDRKEQWNEAMKELLGIEADVDVFTVNFTELDGLSLSLNDMDAIDFMVDASEEFKK